MVARVRNADRAPIGLHVTFLNERGKKAFGDRSRLMYGRVASGAVLLATVRRDGVLAVAEGIETALAFEQLHGVPTWAALSTSGLQTFRPPAIVRRLIIAADSDDGGAGMKAAQALAERVSRLCAAEIRPAPEGRDWADVVRERNA
jgi:putative DNA primase/helicase